MNSSNILKLPSKYFLKHFLQQKLLHFGHDIGSSAGDKHIAQFTKSNTLWDTLWFNVWFSCSKTCKLYLILTIL